jgi:hypothetical protein
VFSEVHLAHPAFAEFAIDEVAVSEEGARQAVRRILEDQGGAVEGAETVVTLIPRPALRTELVAHVDTARRPFDCDAFTWLS